ncbi:MAG: type II toxin-antitoxin system RelE/ParE family toxin [Bryobacteraceae bacterium]
MAIHRRIRREAPQAAARWSKGIRAHIKTLVGFPERCPLGPESETFDEPIRQLLFGRGSRGTYRILFAVLEKTVFALHVRHGSMDVLRPELE